MKLRDSMVFIHRWLALVAGAFWGIAALTGGILVFESEIDGWLNGGRFAVTNGELPPGALDRALAENFPGETVASMAWVYESHVFRITMRSDTGSRRVFVDAGSGRETRETRPRLPLLGLVRRAHTNLFAGRYGYWVVTLTSAAAVLSMITGLYLWWPGIRSFARGFAVRMKRGAYILNFDLHQVVGAVTFVLLFAMTATGVIMGVPRAGPGLARMLLSETPAPAAAPAPARPRAVESPPGIEELARIAEQAGGGRITSLSFPEAEPDRVDVRVIREDGVGEQVRVVLARADGSVLDVFDSSTWGREQRFGDLLSRWHTGGFRSLIVRILFSAACFLGALIFATGLVIWWVKRRRKLESARRRAAAAMA